MSYPDRPQRIKRGWLLLANGSLAGLVALISLGITYFAFRQQRADSIASDYGQATMVAILDAQLQVQRELATVQANPVQVGPTATLLAQRRNELLATQEALNTARTSLEATQTVLVRQGTAAQAGAVQPESTSVADLGPLVVNCPAKLAFGQTAECTINAAAEVDSYAIDAETNDQLLLRLVKVSGDLAPQLVIQDANGNQVCQAANQRLIDIFPCALNSTGTFNIKVQDYNGKATGAYKLYVQRLNAPGLIGKIDLGKAFDGEIKTVGGVTIYRFDAMINDQLLLRLNKTAGALAPAVGIYDASGRQVCNGANPTTVAFLCSITASGQYALLVDDYNRNATGRYRSYFQRLNKPANATALSINQPLDGALDAVAEFDSFTFEGKASESLNATLTRTSGSFAPRIQIYDPSGTLLCERADPAVAQIEGCALKVDGIYTVLVDDYNIQQVGGYTLAIQRS